MKTLQIGRTEIPCKEYECSRDDVYLPKEELKLRLYIELTDTCPAACPFCVFSGVHRARNHPDPEKLRNTLRQIFPFVSGISLTGGEPMTDIPLLEEVIRIVQETMPPETELDLVTNGLNIQRLPDLKGLKRFATIHISRHAADDQLNAALMRWKKPPPKELLKEVFSALPDPGATVLNCVLQKPGVHDLKSVCEYMETAAEINAANVSLIGLFHANDYCKNNYVSPLSLNLEADPRFTAWNHFHDHDFCQCSTGDYKAKAGYIRYYFRCPGNIPTSKTCRQLVYGSDDILRAGFGNAEQIEL